MPCACLCCYSIPVEIGPLAPGPYQVDFFWHDETGPRHVYLDVTVPEWGGRGEFAGRGTQVDPPPCIAEPTVAPVPEPLGHGQPTASSLALTGCYPTPARGGVTIRYALPDDGPIHLAIFGPGGSEVRTILDGHAQKGPGSVIWDGHDDAGGPEGTTDLVQPGSALRLVGPHSCRIPRPARPQCGLADRNPRRGTEAVTTAPTRNRLGALRPTWVRIPPSPPLKARRAPQGALLHFPTRQYLSSNPRPCRSPGARRPTAPRRRVRILPGRPAASRSRRALPGT